MDDASKVEGELCPNCGDIIPSMAAMLDGVDFADIDFCPTCGFDNENGFLPLRQSMGNDQQNRAD